VDVSLRVVLLEWGRIGCVGFGGPPAHISLLRRLCVDQRQWLTAAEFEDAIAACNLLPGPASTQLAIYCAWRVRGRLGAFAGGLAFILPGLVVILALSVLFLADSPPRWVRGLGAGADAAVAAVAVSAAWALLVPSWRRARGDAALSPRRLRWGAFLLAGGVSAATIGPWLVLVLLGCGALEVVIRRPPSAAPVVILVTFAKTALTATVVGAGVLLPVAWVAVKVGALSFGGGFVIIPLMQADAVAHGWITSAQFLNAVALGQITPGPVVQTVAVVGYAAGRFAGFGIQGALGTGALASAVAFTPSFVLVLLGASRFGALRADPRAQAFLDGAGPAAIGAILGSAVPLSMALREPWQFATGAGAAVVLLGVRRGVVFTLVAAAIVGLIVALAGGSLPA
jgi:chromate transporter